MTEKSIEQTISEKTVVFEKEILKNRKKEIVETLIKEKVSTVAQLVYVFNNALVGISLGKLFSAIFVEDVQLGIFHTILFSLIALVSSRYLISYWKKDKNKANIIKEILSVRTLKGMKQYLYLLQGKFKYSFLFLNNEKLSEVQKKNTIIESEEIKSFVNDLNKEELALIMDLLKKHNIENGFTIELIDDIKKLCNAKKRERIKEEKFLNNLKNITGNDEEDDLISAMADEYNQEEIKEPVKQKINFKKIL